MGLPPSATKYRRLDSHPLAHNRPLVAYHNVAQPGALVVVVMGMGTLREPSCG